MSYRNNQAIGGRRNTGLMNCPAGIPFMFGGGYASGGQNKNENFYSASATSFGSHPSVRDCFFWPTPILTSASTRSNYASQGFNFNNGYMPQAAVIRQPARAQPVASSNTISSYPQPKAFIQHQRMGGGESKMQPFQIPCRLGPSGSSMAPLSTPKPLTIKVTAPVGAGQDGKPISIKIDPSQFMSMANVKTYTTQRS